MSWLFVVSIPGLLMLATFGLERLESGLDRDTVSADDVAEFLAKAQPDDVGTLARDGMPEALDCLHRRHAERLAIETMLPNSLGTDNEPGLPTRSYARIPTNPQFQPTRHVNRV